MRLAKFPVNNKVVPCIALSFLLSCYPLLYMLFPELGTAKRIILPSFH